MPILSFVGCLALTLWLWNIQAEMPDSVGEVEAVRVDVRATADGKLTEFPRPWKKYDSVTSGDVIARLDSGPAKQQVNTLRVALDRLAKDVDAAEASVHLDQLGRTDTQAREILRLTWDIARLDLDIADRDTVIESTRIELAQYNNRLDALRTSLQKKGISNLEYQEGEYLRDQAKKLLEEHEKARQKAQKQLAEATQRLAQYSEAQQAELAGLIATVKAPLEARVDEQRSLIGELQMQVAALEIRAPITGEICAIWSWPEQYVKAGDPIVTIGSETSRTAVAYVHQEQRFRPTENMEVDVKLRLPNSRPRVAYVLEVGPQYEQVPAHLCKDPARIEFGLPVRIALPNKDFTVRPGELIDVRFKPWTRNREG